MCLSFYTSDFFFSMTVWELLVSGCINPRQYLKEPSQFWTSGTNLDLGSQKPKPFPKTLLYIPVIF